MASDTFSAEELGTGSRRTPVVDIPAWLVKSRGEEDRATLTPDEHAFLASVPAYEDPEAALASLAPPPLARPSLKRRVLSLLMFAVIIGSASALLGMAVMTMLGRSVTLW